VSHFSFSTMPIAWNFFNTPVHVHTPDRNRDTTRGASISIHLGRLARNPPPIALSPRSRDSPPCETLRQTPGGGPSTLTENLLLRHAFDADLLHLPLCKFGLDDGRKVGVRALAYQKPQRGVKPLEKLVVVLDDGPVACDRLMLSPPGLRNGPVRTGWGAPRLRPIEEAERAGQGGITCSRPTAAPWGLA
jgi:hypothetical protein